jgi:hypothetical protein
MCLRLISQTYWVSGESYFSVSRSLSFSHLNGARSFPKLSTTGLKKKPFSHAVIPESFYRESILVFLSKILVGGHTLFSIQR